MSQRLVVIIGSSGVGKTTLASALQEELLPRQWVHFSADTLLYCFPASVVKRVDEDNEHSAVDGNAIVNAAYACARVLLDQGHSVIFDAVVLNRVGAERLRQQFDCFGPLIVELTCSWDTLRDRTLRRGDRSLAEADHGFKNGRGHIKAHLVFDTTETGAQAIAASIAAHMRALAEQPDRTSP